MRTRKNLQQTQTDLELLVNAALESDLLVSEKNDMKLGSSLKSNADAVLKKLKAVGKSEPEAKKMYKDIKKLRSELNMIFEWNDGILIEAMQTGGLLLIDEISLANDSVLERLNSVFESERMLVLSEKSSTEAIKIVAKENFSIVATMNPSGDFGKKELSPALRNRMTEIWVESYFLQKELIDIYSQPNQISANVSLNIHKDLPDSIDLYLIISKMCEDKIPDLSAKVSK